MKKNKNVPVLLFFLINTFSCDAQSADLDSIRIDYKKLYGYALDGKIRPALQMLPGEKTGKISEKDAAFIVNFKNRFAYDKDQSDDLPNEDAGLNALLNIYHNYWRSSFLNNSTNYDTTLGYNLVGFLQQWHPPAKAIDLKLDRGAIALQVSKYLKEYIGLKGMHTTGFGRTGAYLDLLIWKKEKDTIYHLSLGGDEVPVHIVFLDDFISLGWEEYATLGRHYPGGWATREALYCVKKAYDLNSEEFRIGYLSHEGRHFADYSLFPKLSSADLEYRAKLTELSLVKTDLNKSIGFFINNANYESSNSHSIANYCVIRDLSGKLFHKDFETDMTKWSKVSIKKINKQSDKLLKKNTKLLKEKGKNVDYFIKKK